MGSLYNAQEEKLIELKQSFSQCKGCIESVQAYVVNSSMSFKYGFKNADVECHITKIYLEYGTGFCEVNSLHGGELSRKNSKYSLVFMLPRGVKQIRLDPVEDSRCVIINLKVKLDGN